MPRPGDFGLLAGNDPVGLLIRAGEWVNGDGFSRYSHAFVVLDNGELLEAEPGGARIRLLTEYPAGLVAYSDWALTDDQRARMVAEARGLAGTPYSALDYFSLAALRLRIRPPWVTRYVAATGHMICSQLVDEVYRRVGLAMFSDGRFAGDVTPADLEQVLDGPKETTQ